MNGPAVNRPWPGRMGPGAGICPPRPDNSKYEAETYLAEDRDDIRKPPAPQLGCPGEWYCQNECPATLYATAAFTDCEDTLGTWSCSGGFSWSRAASGCTWNNTSGGDCVFVTWISCGGNLWSFIVDPGPGGGPDCCYEKTARVSGADSFPTGVYSCTGCPCSSYPSEIAVYT